MKPITPLLTVDAIILYNDSIVLIKRINEPFKDQYALPGGFVDIGETTEKAVIREAKEETNLDVKIIKLLNVYSEPSRDPRGHTVTLAYLVKGEGILMSGSDAKSIELFKYNQIPKNLAFDHNKIIHNNISVISHNIPTTTIRSYI